MPAGPAKILFIHVRIMTSASRQTGKIRNVIPARHLITAGARPMPRFVLELIQTQPTGVGPAPTMVNAATAKCVMKAAVQSAIR